MSSKPKTDPTAAPQAEGRPKRTLSGWQGWLASAVAIAMSLYHINYSVIMLTNPWIYRTAHVAFTMVLVFLLTPATSKSPTKRVPWYDWLLIVGALIIPVYIANDVMKLSMRAGVEPTQMDVYIGVLLIVLVLECVRRYVSPALALTALLFLAYALFGYMVPGRFALPKYAFPRVISYLNSTFGVYGIAVATSSTFVFLFVLFGAFLAQTGVGKVFIDLSQALAGGYRGGPAKVAVISSALFGSISGSTSSNIVTTGSFTIPLMKKVGYRPEFAAAVECDASVGGLFMPPVMGAGAFIMAEMLGVPYATIMRTALVPALLYFMAIFLLVDLEAGRTKLKGQPKSELPLLRNVLLGNGYLLLPIIVLIYMLTIAKVSPIMAAMWSIVSALVLSGIKKETRLSPKDILQSLEKGAKSALTVACATACAGIVVGVVSLTGVGLTFSSLLIDVARGSMLPTLLISALVTIILGMGLPVTATYITVAAIIAPALTTIGVHPLAAHLFLYFFAAVSNFTPPVCIGAYVAAGVATCNPVKAANEALRLGAIAFILPFMFVYGPALVLVGSTGAIVQAAVSAVLGILCFGGGIHGWIGRDLDMWERVLLVIGGLALIHVGAVTNLIGVGALVLVLGRQMLMRKTLAAN